MRSSVLPFATLLSLAMAAPLPLVITRMHTAAPVTTTQLYTTGTTTVQLPPVEIFISNGVTYTFTLDESPAADPTTFTLVLAETPSPAADPSPSTVSPVLPDAPSPAAPSPNTPAQNTPAANTPAANTPAANTPAANTPAPAPTPDATTSQDVPPATQNTPPTEQTSQTTTPAQVQTTTATTAPAEDPAPNTPATQQTTSTTPNPPANKPTTITTTSNSIPTTLTTAVSTSTSTSSSSSSHTGSIPPPKVIVYSPYEDSGACKDANAIKADLVYIQSFGINLIRTYGTDCLSLTGVLPACIELGIKVDQGIWIDYGIDSGDASVDALISWGLENGWDVFGSVTVGNEVVNSGFATASELISKISSVKAKLRAAGYNGDVTTAEPPVSFEKFPELCTESEIDFVAINPHPYFDATSTPEQAGQFVLGEKAIVQGVCGSKSVVITETGYPHKGDSNGLQVPSEENQRIAINAIIEATNGDITILTTYDDFWKNPGNYGIEQYFGAITLFS